MRYLLVETNLFNSTLSALSFYNKLSYKHIIREVIPSLRQSNKKHEEGVEYIIPINGDNIFEEIHGKTELVYYVKDGKIFLDRIEPSLVLLKLRAKVCEIYKGIPVFSEVDKFKVDLLKKLGGQKGGYR